MDFRINFLFMALAMCLTILSTVEGTLGTIVRGHGLNGQYYTGSGVGPLWLFRSSADNAALVKAGLQGHPIQQSLMMALGDEFPQPRDDLIRWNLRPRYPYGYKKSQQEQEQGTESELENTYTESSVLPDSVPSSPFANIFHWRYDKNNAQKELNSPYRRPNPITSIATFGSRVRGAISSSASSVKGILQAVSSSSNSDKKHSGPRITIDTPTRSPIPIPQE